MIKLLRIVKYVGAEVLEGKPWTPRLIWTFWRCRTSTRTSFNHVWARVVLSRGGTHERAHSKERKTEHAFFRIPCFFFSRAVSLWNMSSRFLITGNTAKSQETKFFVCCLYQVCTDMLSVINRFQLLHLEFDSSF